MMDGDAAVARPLFRQKSGPLAVGWLAGETLGTFFVLANPFPLFPSLSLVLCSGLLSAASAVPQRLGERPGWLDQQ